MNKLAKKITKADLISLEEYSKKRKVLRKEIVSYKKNRRIELGQYANFYFVYYELHKLIMYCLFNKRKSTNIPSWS